MCTDKTICLPCLRYGSDNGSSGGLTDKEGVGFTGVPLPGRRKDDTRA